MSVVMRNTIVYIVVLIIYFFSWWHISCSEQYFQRDIIEEKLLVVVIPSYNNSRWYSLNLDSVFDQRYTNYRVIYIDDCSPDGTGNLVERYIKEKEQGHRVTLIKNKKRRGALANHYTAGHLCKDHEIILNLDGDDWLKHDKVFAKINEVYQDPNVWLTYGQYEEYPKGICGHAQAVPRSIIIRNAYREYPWITSALRTYYAGLFKCIQLEDLLYQGSFYPVACDLAFMFPMLEMANGRCRFISDILYVYNCATLANDFKRRPSLQWRIDRIIRKQKKYLPLKKPSFYQQEQKNYKANLVI